MAPLDAALPAPHEVDRHARAVLADILNLFHKRYEMSQ